MKPRGTGLEDGEASGIFRQAGVNLDAPVLCGEYCADSVSTCEYLARAGEAVAAMPVGAPGGSADLRESCRAARAAFLSAHGEQIYLELTDGLRQPMRLAELAYQAAETFPGLAPTKEQMTSELSVPQSRKQGREIDQGIFFWGILRSRTAGTHLVETMLQPTPRALRMLAQFRRSGHADLGKATIERNSGVAYVTMRNDLYLNAEDDASVEDLETAIDLALLDDDVRVGVLRGGLMSHPRYAGRRVFSAGINLTDLYNGRISFLNFLLRRELGYINKLRHGITIDQAAPAAARRMGKPWVGAVDTFAIGGGMQVLLVLDRVIAESRAYFSLPALQEGIIPGAANLRLARLMGARGARRMIFGGDKIKATDATSAWICDDVVEPADMDTSVGSAAGRLANPAVTANRNMMHLAEEPEDQFRDYMAAYALEQVHRLYSPDLIANLESNWISR